MTKDNFLSRKTPVKAITLPDGEPAHIRKLSDAEVTYILKNYTDPDKVLEGNRFIVCKGLADDNGIRILDDGDQSKLSGLEFDDIASIAQEVLAFSGVRDRSAKKP